LKITVWNFRQDKQTRLRTLEKIIEKTASQQKQKAPKFSLEILKSRNKQSLKQTNSVQFEKLSKQTMKLKTIIVVQTASQSDHATS
jgi:hypothetical protein